MNLTQYGWNEEYRFKSDDKVVYGRVVEIQRSLYKVICEYGEVNAKLKGSFYKNNKTNIFPVVGDFVTLRYEKIGESIIEKICNRKTQFSRTDFSGHAAGYVKTIKEQVLCSNFDYIFIFSSLNNDFNLKKITRYVSTALKGKARTVVVLTKADLCSEVEDYLNKVREISSLIDVIAISSKTGYGLNKVKEYMTEGSTVVFVGSSGVGKSSLVNAIMGKEVMAVGEIRESDSTGHHTTTHRQLLQLGENGMIIDTPGIRELGLWDAEEGIKDTFSDVVELMSRCKFRNCSHHHEPGCAVIKAIEDGKLTKERWQMYCQMADENEFGLKKSIVKKKR